jgi:ParB family chromosome partitioning protein
MDAMAQALAAEQGVAWVKPTLDAYVTHDHLEGLHRVPTMPTPLSEAELARIAELDAAYDVQAAILEDEGSEEAAIAAAEAAIEAIETEGRSINNRPPFVDPEVKPTSGMFLTLGRDGVPVLEPHYFTENAVSPDTAEDDVLEVVTSDGDAKPARATLSQRLVDELAMQRRDILALHVASDPALALDIFVFTLADADALDWRASSGMTLTGRMASGPVTGFEAPDAPATASLAELRQGLDESWKAGTTQSERFDLYRALGDDVRAAWLGHVVARTFEASLNAVGPRSNAFHDHLGQLIDIDMAAWWRPTAANYFDRVPKAVILDALHDVGGISLSSRFASAKKSELAASAERVFAGNFITEVDVKDRALAWVPAAMTFGKRCDDDAAAVAEQVADAAVTRDAASDEGDDASVSGDEVADMAA